MRTLLAVAAFALLAVALPARGAESDVHFVGSGVIRGDLGPAHEGDPLAAARDALTAVAGELAVDPAAFRFDDVRRSIVGTHVRGREYRGGVPVAATSAAVHVVDGRVWQVEARPSHLRGRPEPAAITAAAARATALARVGVRTPFAAPRAERLLVEHDGALVDVWRVTVVSLTPAVVAEVDVSARDGGVLAVRDPRLYVDGSATVFDPSPLVSARNKHLRQPGERGLPADADLDSAELTAQRTTLPLRDLDLKGLAQGRLSGPFVDVVGAGPDADGHFDLTRADPRFEATMAYAHLDRVQRYFQSLGFVGEASVNAEPQDVVATRVEGFDNSFYMQGYDFLLFGTGGVDDGEDAEVILHEYGHAIHDAQVPSWGDHAEGGAMGEGFGDFLAGAYFAGGRSGGFQDTCIMDWDATSYSSADPPCLRRMDTGKTYPKHMTGSIHANGEIWSEMLWRLRDTLVHPDDPRPDAQEKTDNVLMLVLASHEFLTTTARFADAVAALRTAADALGHPEWKPLIDRAATDRGFPLRP